MSFKFVTFGVGLKRRRILKKTEYNGMKKVCYPHGQHTLTNKI